MIEFSNISYFIEEQRPDGTWEDVDGIPEDDLDSARNRLNYLRRKYPLHTCKYRIVKHQHISEVVEEFK